MNWFTALMSWFRKEDSLKQLRQELRKDAELKYGLNIYGYKPNIIKR